MFIHFSPKTSKLELFVLGSGSANRRRHTGPKCPKVPRKTRMCAWTCCPWVRLLTVKGWQRSGACSGARQGIKGNATSVHEGMQVHGHAIGLAGCGKRTLDNDGATALVSIYPTCKKTLWTLKVCSTWTTQDTHTG